MRETRVIKVASLRAEGDGRPKIFGYAATFDQPTVIRDWFGEFQEVIRPGAFTDALKAEQDVRALVDHDPSKVLGRWPKPGTLKLTEDETGLRMEIDPPDTTHGRDIVESIRRGDITGASFGFKVRDGGEQWSEDGSLRELRALDVFDVSVVTFPAYDSASVGLRSAEDLRTCKTLRPWLEEQRRRERQLYLLMS